MNVANALGVYVLLSAFGVSGDEIAHGLASFKGVVRRQEVVGEAAGVTVVDDFAHHPTAIGVTLEAIAERFAGRRILAAFEPRSNTARRNVFQDGVRGRVRSSVAGLPWPRSISRKTIRSLLASGWKPPRSRARSVRAVRNAFACASNDEILERMLADAHDGRRRAVHVKRPVRWIEGTIPRRVESSVG